ncbi:MAG TPA: hypothetical protein VFM71_08790 [Gemmatimonadaceae bacterium]|nr:hypothetical protein [Gemmatimonadaceae bacterium]
MSSGLLLLLLVGVAFLAAHVASDFVAKKFVVVSGAEYLIMGILLGPNALGVLSEAQLELFAPVTLLTLGFLGLALGMRCHLPTLVRVPSTAWKLAFGQSLLTLITVAAIITALLLLTEEMTLWLALPPAFALGAIAAVSLPQAVEVGARALGREGPTVLMLRTSTLVDGLVGVCAFGILMALDHRIVPAFERHPTATEWAVIATGIGVTSGVLFHLFLGGEKSGDRTMIALAGATLLCTGAATHLGLSPLFSTTVMGVILVNTSRQREFLQQLLARAERPLVFVMLVLAGATWNPGSDAGVVLPVVVFLLARWLGKVGGARLVTRANGLLRTHGPEWGRALLGQGSLALALGFTWLLREGSELRHMVFSAALASMVLTDLSAARLVRSVLEPLLPFEGTAAAGRSDEPASDIVSDAPPRSTPSAPTRPLTDPAGVPRQPAPDDPIRPAGA